MSTAVGPNWAGSYSYRAAELVTPPDAAALAAVVRSSPRVRALGTRHSFNDLADTSGTLVTLVGLPAHPELSDDGSTVTVSAGTRFAELAAWLEQRGFALHNLGSLPHISVGGAVATGTHGSGVGNGNLATAVAALEVVDGRGEIVRLARGDDSFEGAVVALGALGVVTRVTLDVQPSYRMRQDLFVDLPWEAVLADVAGILSSAYSVSLFTDWTGETLKQAWVKSRLDGVGSSPALDGLGTPGHSFFGARPAGAKALSPAGDVIDNTTVQGGVPGPWNERLPHFRADVTPSAGDEIQTEYFVALADAPAALAAVRALAPQIAPHLLVTELRAVAADGLWLSTAYRRESLAIHFTWMLRPDEVRAVLPLIEEALAPFAARPHWGKWFAAQAPSIVPLYERAADFAALAERFDPDHRFRNAYLTRALALPA
ncbi:MAG: FAD-binding protein [Herbiconiux sp.]|nr:FAD-binding protein [Herbiconiux sp.]